MLACYGLWCLCKGFACVWSSPLSLSLSIITFLFHPFYKDIDIDIEASLVLSIASSLCITYRHCDKPSLVSDVRVVIILKSEQVASHCWRVGLIDLFEVYPHHGPLHYLLEFPMHGNKVILDWCEHYLRNLHLMYVAYFIIREHFYNSFLILILLVWINFGCLLKIRYNEIKTLYF